MLIYSHTRPAQAVAGYCHFWIGEDEAQAATTPSLNVIRCWQHGKRTLLLLQDINDANAAQTLVKKKIWIDRNEVSVDADEYLWGDLEGMQVVDVLQQRQLGQVSAVQNFGAQDVLLVQANDDSGEWMIPFIDDVVLQIDANAAEIQVQLLDGMDACFTPKS